MAGVSREPDEPVFLHEEDLLRQKGSVSINVAIQRLFAQMATP
jgi:hypothetical protein